MKTNENFKLSKEAKRMLSTIDDKARRADVRKLFIESEYLYEAHKRKSSKSREKSED